MSNVVYGWEENGRFACSWFLFHEIRVFHVLILFIVCIIMCLLLWSLCDNGVYRLLLVFLLTMFICRTFK
jgi:hypothetical protein